MINIPSPFLPALALSVLPVAALALGPSPSPLERPNVLIIMVDDMGFSDIGCFGGEIRTPNIDRLAENGLKFSQMYNTAKCYPTRASLLTGLYFQRTDRDFTGTATLGEMLRPAGYRTLWSGKHHARFNPTTRGFDEFEGLLGGAQNHFNPGSTAAPGQPRPGTKGDGNRWVIDGREVADFVPQDPAYYDTDAFTDQALEWIDESAGETAPFLLYLAYTAPHWPLQAWPEDVAKYKGVYDVGYEPIRQARYRRQVEMGLIDPATAPLSPLDEHRRAVPWESLSAEERRKEATRMELYAAMMDRVDQNIGRLVERLEQHGELENTLILFLSDNGACAEYPKVQYYDPEAPMGSVASYDSYGAAWATVGNTPLRKWKTTSHEGGIRTPLVAHWPAGIEARSDWVRDPVHIIDIAATLRAIGEGEYPGTSPASDLPPLDGVSLVPAFRGQPVERNRPLFFEFNKGAAIRDGRWKLVRLGTSWELYDMDTNLTETNDLAASMPERVETLSAAWDAWMLETTGKAYDPLNPTVERE